MFKQRFQNFLFNGEEKMNLLHELHERIVDFLLSLPKILDNNSQQALIYSAGLDHRLQSRITIGGSADKFVRLLIPTLLDYGKLKDGRNTLEAVLEAAKS